MCRSGLAAGAVSDLMSGPCGGAFPMRTLAADRLLITAGPATCLQSFTDNIGRLSWPA